MLTGNEPAMPTDIWCESIKGGFYQEGTDRGLSIRQHFALNAPEVPDWFVYKGEEEAPKRPPSWNEIPGLDEKTREALRDWTHDPIYDLPEELMWFQKSWNDYYDANEIFKKEQTVNRFFAWRTFYAKRLIEQLNKD